MKKIFYSLFCILIIVTNIGCTKKSSEVTAVTTGLSFTANITYDDIKLVCDGIINNGKSQFLISSPDNIKDLKYLFEDGSASINYKGLEYKVNGELPENNAISFLNNILADANKIKDSVTKTEEAFLISSDIGGKDYTIYLGQSGLPLKIISKDENFEAVIKNATLLNSNGQSH